MTTVTIHHDKFDNDRLAELEEAIEMALEFLACGGDMDPDEILHTLNRPDWVNLAAALAASKGI